MTAMHTPYKDGWLCVVDSYTLTDEPKRFIGYWPISQGPESWWRDCDLLDMVDGRNISNLRDGW